MDLHELEVKCVLSKAGGTADSDIGEAQWPQQWGDGVTLQGA